MATRNSSTPGSRLNGLGSWLAVVRGASLEAMLVSAVALGAGCAAHTVRPAVTARVYIDDRGIFVPLPPPSYIAAPVQQVAVEGEFRGEPVEAGSTLRVHDLHGEADLTFPVEAGQRTFAIELELDLTDNCLELWLETEDGQTSEVAQAQAIIRDEAHLDTLPECD